MVEIQKRTVWKTKFADFSFQEGNIERVRIKENNQSTPKNGSVILKHMACFFYFYENIKP